MAVSRLELTLLRMSLDSNRNMCVAVSRAILDLVEKGSDLTPDEIFVAMAQVMVDNQIEQNYKDMNNMYAQDTAVETVAGTGKIEIAEVADNVK